MLLARRPPRAAALSAAASAILAVLALAVAPSRADARIYWGTWVDGATYGYSANPPWDMRAVWTFESHAGKRISLLHFGQPWYRGGVAQPFAPTPYETTRLRGSIPFVDWNSWDSSAGVNQPAFSLSRIIGGAYDPYIRAWATAARAWGHPFLLRFDHEMNGTWFPWGEKVNGNAAGEFVQAWRHVHDIFVAVGARNVTWVWCPNTAYTGSTPISSLWPGSGYVDWTCIDGYNWGVNPVQPNVWKSFAEVMRVTYDQVKAVAPTKPMVIGETASSELGGSKAAWITQTLASLPTAFPLIRGFVWFDVRDRGMDWPIESSSSAQTAFRNAIASPTYTANTFGSIPWGPVPPP